MGSAPRGEGTGDPGGVEAEGGSGGGSPPDLRHAEGSEAPNQEQNPNLPLPLYPFSSQPRGLTLGEERGGGGPERFRVPGCVRHCTIPKLKISG